VVNGASVLARFELCTDVIERFFSMLKDMPSILAIATMRGKIGCHILRFGRTRGLNNVGFAMLNGHAISHAVFSSYFPLFSPLIGPEQQKTGVFGGLPWLRTSGPCYGIAGRDATVATVATRPVIYAT
jgi:hypothetical protein